MTYDELRENKIGAAMKAVGMLQGLVNCGDIPAHHRDLALEILAEFDAATAEIDSHIAASKADYLANPPSWDAWMNEPQPF